jgi:hypothetical protein
LTAARTCVVVLACLTASLGCGADAELSVVTAPIVDDGSKLPVVEGRINGRAARDPFATVSASLLGVPAAQAVRLDSLCVADYCLTGVAAWATDTPFIRPEPGAINAALGRLPLASFVVELDHGRTLRLHRVAPSCETLDQPLYRDNASAPVVTAARVDEIDLDVVKVESGSRYTQLSEVTAARLPYLPTGAQEIDRCNISGCSATSNFVSRVNRFCVGSACQTWLEVKFPVWDSIGSNFLNQFRVLVDFGRSKIRFCP